MSVFLAHEFCKIEMEATAIHLCSRWPSLTTPGMSPGDPSDTAPGVLPATAVEPDLNASDVTATAAQLPTFVTAVVPPQQAHLSEELPAAGLHENSRDLQDLVDAAMDKHVATPGMPPAVSSDSAAGNLLATSSIGFPSTPPAARARDAAAPFGVRPAAAHFFDDPLSSWHDRAASWLNLFCGFTILLVAVDHISTMCKGSKIVEEGLPTLHDVCGRLRLTIQSLHDVCGRLSLTIQSCFHSTSSQA